MALARARLRDRRSGQRRKQALARLVEHSPDIVVLDALMPGLTTHSAVSCARASVRLEALPVLMLTGLRDEASITWFTRRARWISSVKSTQAGACLPVACATCPGVAHAQRARSAAALLARAQDPARWQLDWFSGQGPLFWIEGRRVLGRPGRRRSASGRALRLVPSEARAEVPGCSPEPAPRVGAGRGYAGQ